MITIVRKLEFDYGHRVLGHEGKCRHFHGHRGVAEIEVVALDLDSVGRVIDFGVVKELVGGWTDVHWDHSLLLHSDDPQLLHLKSTEERPPYVMKFGNPTAENMARELFGIAEQLLSPYQIRVQAVVIWETPACRAEYRVSPCLGL